MEKVSKTKVFIFYAILIVVLAVAGFFIGRWRKGNTMVYALVGAAIGLVVSVILWFAWAKKNTY